MSVHIVTGPTELAVSPIEVRRRLRIDDTEDEEDVKRLIRAATLHAEKMLNRSLLTRTLRYTLSGFYAQRMPDPTTSRSSTKNFRTDDVYLPFSPVASVTSVQYLNESATLTTLPSANYELDTNGHFGAIRPAYGYDWPETLDHPSAVRITYVAGGTASALESDLILALMLLIGHWYLNREATAMMTINDLPIGVQSLLAPWVIYQ
jgi:hypothetical protein